MQEWPCSQHNYGLAFDMVSDAENCGRIGMVTPAWLARFCRFFPSACQTSTPFTCQDALGLMGKSIGLHWVSSDPVHFAAFPSALFISHVRQHGWDCTLCRPA